jgi:hypothetical protein
MDVNDIGGTNSSYSTQIADLVHQGTSQSAQDMAGQYTSGNSEARGLLKDPGNTNRQLAFDDHAMGDAIRSKYTQNYAHKESQLNNKMLQSADQDHIRQLNVAANMAGEEVEQNRQKEMLRWKMQQANRAQRGQVLGHVLGITGAVVAGIYTGGAGAAAGLAAGEAAGNAIGSAN